MKKRFKAILGRVAAFFSALPFAISSLAFPASADEQYLRLSWSTWSDMVGASVQGYYLADGDLLKPITLTLRTNSSSKTGTITSVDMDVSDSSMLVNSYLAVYECTIPSDVKLSSDSFLPVLQVDWNVHFSNVTYVGYVGGTFVNTVFTTLSRSSLSQYNYLQSGSSSSGVVSLPGRSSDSSLAGLYRQSTVSSTYDCSGCFYSYTGNATDLYIGTQYFSNLRSVGSNSNKWYVMLSAPYINPDYVFEGNDPPPSIPDSSTTANGSGSGTITENSSGGYDFSYNIEVEVPDYSAQFNDLESAINPDYDSSNLDRLSSNVDDYQTVEDSLLDLANDGLSSTPDLEFDDSLIEDAYNPLDSFFGINIVGIMVFWVGCIAFISYILFGKWV